MPIITPDFFRHEELYMSASLQAVVDGKLYDLTGRRYFNAELFGAEGIEVQTSKNFAQNIGFGITDINIDVSTSLQPIIEITFKDLYGNTMFGSNNSQSIDYSVFFAWPPPKFKFTFKGYLGRQVTYMLSLKKYDISFNSDDASYSIKGVFVPHQWGFFADLPFSFILAAKALKEADGLLVDDAEVQNITEYQSSIQDIIEVGTEVDITTNQISNKFDGVLERLNRLGGTPTDFAALPSPFEIIRGSVDGQEIPNFVTLQLDQAQIELIDRETYKNNNVPGLREYVFSKVLVGGQRGRFFNNPLEDFSNDEIIDNQKKQEIRTRVTDVISDNRNEIEKQISALRFDATQGQLNKLTISRVLNQLAADSAYVMGRILEAGIKGYSEFEDARKQAVEQDNLIARHYPLIIDDEGQEVPAKDASFGIEAQGNELDFVRIFTDAVIKGIVDFQNVANINPEEVTDDVAHPISVLEIFAPKPYAGVSANKFKTDILARSAIAAWFTKNDVITEPGDADEESIAALVDLDFQNITQSDLRRLPATEREQLKEFCVFWERLINREGTQFRLPSGDVNDETYNLQDYLKTNVTDVVQDEILDYLVVVDYGGQKQAVEALQSQQELIDFLATDEGANVRAVTVRSVLNPIIGEPTGDLSSIAKDTMAGDHFMNNGIPYFTGAHKKERDFDTFWIAFVGEDAVAANNILNGAEDVIFIEEAREDDGEDLTDDAEEFNELVDQEIVFDYQKIRFRDSDKELNDNLTNFQTNAWTNRFDSTQAYKDAFLMQRKIKTNTADAGIDVDGEGPILLAKAFRLNTNSYKNTGEVIDSAVVDVATDVLQSAADMATWINSANVPASIAADWLASVDFVEPNERVAFDLWTGKRTGFDNNGAIEGRYQRQYIRAMCSNILDLIQQLESEDNQVISQVLGNAQEGENVIYKQFHSLFQQWNSIVFQDDVDAAGCIVNSVAPSPNELAIQLMREYGSCGFGSGLNTADGNYVEQALNSDRVTPRSGVFVYDFPLQRIKQAGQAAASEEIRVENSLINTDALTEARSDTTVLNVIQSICSKNNFMFIPIPGYANYLDINDIYTPKAFNGDQRVVNFFHVMFIPTPESRALKPTDTYTTPAALARSQESLEVNALEVKYGSTENNVVRNVQVSTQDNKVTAESVINLERLVNNENANKRVTTDCSMLNVMAGRSYKATIDIIGNAQVFPMQFFFIRNLPMFDGLYQILNVKHTITPNNFETSMEGIRMRFFSENDYGGVFPITLESLAKLAEERGIAAAEADAENNESARDQIPDIGIDGGEEEGVVSSTDLSGDVSQIEVELGPATAGFKNSRRLQTSNDKKMPITDNPGKANKESIIQSMNYFIRDIFEPWAAWLKQKHPQVYKQVYITSAIRNSRPNGGSSNSRHFYGQAIDFQIIRGNRIQEELDWNLRLFNTIMEWYEENPDKKYDQLLLETRNNRNSIWIHWAYNWEGENRGMRRRFKNDSTLWSADMNGVNRRDQVSKADAKFL